MAKGKPHRHKLIQLPRALAARRALGANVSLGSDQKAFSCLCRGPLWITTDPTPSFRAHLTDVGAR